MKYLHGKSQIIELFFVPDSLIIQQYNINFVLKPKYLEYFMRVRCDFSPCDTLCYSRYIVFSGFVFPVYTKPKKKNEKIEILLYLIRVLCALSLYLNLESYSPNYAFRVVNKSLLIVMSTILQVKVKKLKLTQDLPFIH